LPASVVVELVLQLLDLGVRLFAMFLVARVAQLRARLLLGLALGLLRTSDLVLDFVDGASDDRAGETVHRRVEHVGALLDHLCQQGVVPDPDGLRDLAQGRVGGVRIVEVIQRAQQEPCRPSDQDAQRTAEDPDRQADDSPARGAGEAVTAGFILHLDATVGIAGNDRGIEPEKRVIASATRFSTALRRSSACLTSAGLIGGSSFGATATRRRTRTGVCS
jgi:hypothetical protein